MHNILLVDDERDLVWAIRHSLVDEGYEVSTAYDGVEALTVAQQQRPDVIVLDIGMPRLDGLDVCHKIRRDPRLAAVPILFLTKRSAIEDRLAGFEEDGDDYLGKPFDLRELKARIRSLLRRSLPEHLPKSEPAQAPATITEGWVTLDSRTFQVQVGEKVIQLTTTEFELLHFFMLHPGQIFSSRHLLQQVWGYPPDTADPSLVRWHIKNLRAKIEPDPSQPICILNISRHGYLFERRQPRPR